MLCSRLFQTKRDYTSTPEEYNSIRIVIVLIRIQKFLIGKRGQKYYLILISKQGQFF